MLIQNEELKTLLQEKEILVKEGREANAELELKAEPIATKVLLDSGVKIDDVKDENGNVVFKGGYNILVKAFGTGNLEKINQLINAELGDELEEQKAKEMTIIKMNEKASVIVKEQILPTLNLKETEQLSKIELTEAGDIELEVIDVVESFKERYLASLKQ